MAIVQKGGDHQGTAGRPGLQLVQVGQCRCHHVGTPVGTVDAGALLGIVVWHVEHMTYGKMGSEVREVRASTERLLTKYRYDGEQRLKRELGDKCVPAALINNK